MRKHEIAVVLPYRLDLTVAVLRRLSTNVVDVVTPEGVYTRALSGFPEPAIVRVTQPPHRASLSIAIEGDKRQDPSVLGIVRGMLGADRDVTCFNRAAAHIPWLAPLARRMRGVKPPRYPSLWEACVNAIMFQQISLRAASAIIGRMIVALGESVKTDGVPVPLYPFPTSERFQRATDIRLRAAGLSGAKLATLRRVAEALESGTLDATMLEQSTSSEATSILRRIKGIGPWTAVVILLRGLGRLDVFPDKDTSVASNITLVARSTPFDLPDVLKSLGSQRGMLYYHLLLARLEIRDEIGRQSFEKGLYGT